MTVRFSLLDSSAKLPTYAHPGDAGMDVCSIEDVVIAPGARALIKTGFAMELPDGFEAQVRPRSGLAIKSGITVLNTPGTIDSGYRGEVGVILINLSDVPFHVEKGMKIAQMVIAKFERAEIEVVGELSSSERGAGGFGSTGV